MFHNKCKFQFCFFFQDNTKSKGFLSLKNVETTKTDTKLCLQACHQHLEWLHIVLAHIAVTCVVTCGFSEVYVVLF